MHLLPKRVAAEVLRRLKSFDARQVFPAVLLNSFTTMADITSIACLYLLWKRERRRNARRLWVHETIRSRTELGEFHRLLQELRLDGERFQRYLRLTPAQFDDLLARIGARISRLDIYTYIYIYVLDTYNWPRWC